MNFVLQKASMWKRISAFLFDMILLVIMAIGFALALSAITGYSAKLDTMTDFYAQYGEEYGIDLSVTQTEYDAYSEEERALYQEAINAMNADSEVQGVYTTIVSLSFFMISIGLLLAFLVVEVLPALLLKNGQSLGKKIFGIALMRVDGVRVTPFQVCVRAILGKYTVETMIPICLLLLAFFGALNGFVSLTILVLLLVMEVVVLIVSHSGQFVHDQFAQTVCVDYASQLIFETYDDLIAHKNRVHAEMVERDKTY